MSWEIQAFIEELLPKRTDIEERKSFIRDLCDCKKKIALHGIDSHKIAAFSTESFADKVSLILVPLLASTGLTVPKFSAHEITAKNSVLAKLESIPGLQTVLSPEEIKGQLSKTGAVILAVPEPINSFFKKIKSHLCKNIEKNRFKPYMSLKLSPPVISATISVSYKILKYRLRLAKRSLSHEPGNNFTNKPWSTNHIKLYGRKIFFDNLMGRVLTHISFPMRYRRYF